MELENDTLHVVIRLPFKRPQGFVEPPSIVWTDEMEHMLWKYMSQKKTDWNFIAEQLGVPTSYVVRHAAFVYETQLRGIHQQLRINGNSSISRTSTKSPTKQRSSSTRYSLQQDYPPESSTTSSRLIENLKSSLQPMHVLDSSDDDRPPEPSEDDTGFSHHFERMRLQIEEPAFLPQKSTDTNVSLTNSRQQLSMSIQNLKKLNTESPSITQPQSPVIGDHPSTAPGSTNESAIHSMGSSFSDLSDSSVTQSALEEAFLSKFNQGSKMSIMNFSRRYRE